MSTLTYAQLSTLLAALRHWQTEVDYSERLSYPHFDDVEPLNNDEIEQLCDLLNGSEALTEADRIDLISTAPANSNNFTESLESVNQFAQSKGLRVELAAAYRNHPWVEQYQNPFVGITSDGRIITTFSTLQNAAAFIQILHDEEPISLE